MKIKDYKRIHFVGIGGVSMSGLAAILNRRGHVVTGSDRAYSENIKKLESMGLSVAIGHDRKLIEDADLVVFTAAISNEDPEMVASLELGKKCVDRATLLGSLMSEYQNGIAISGTHGKTTTTSMLAEISMVSKANPTVLVGGNVDAIGGNYIIGDNELFITEACEYKASFLKFNPKIAILLNIDEDHLDYYRDLEHIKDTFREFVSSIPKEGYLIACIEDENVRDVITDAKCNVITYGFNNADYIARDISFGADGKGTFTVQSSEESFRVSIGTTGKHNILNALSVIAVSKILGFENENIQKGLGECKGAHKRFEYKGNFNGASVIDDYAHHPVEIKATLDTVNLLDCNKKYVVFQPHTYTRTKTLFNEFATCFNDCDELILMDIYAAREKDNGEISSVDLGNEIRKSGQVCINVHSHEEAVLYLKDKVKSNDVVMTVGAGDVVIVGEKLLAMK